MKDQYDKFKLDDHQVCTDVNSAKFYFFHVLKVFPPRQTKVVIQEMVVTYNTSADVLYFKS